MADVIFKKVSVFQEKGVDIKKIIDKNRRTITGTFAGSYDIDMKSIPQAACNK